MAIDVGRVAYQCYHDVILERDKNDLPKWENLGKTQQDAWRHAACAVYDYFEDLRNQDPDIIG